MKNRFKKISTLLFSLILVIFFSTPFSNNIVATDYFILLETGLSDYADGWFAPNGRIIGFLYIHLLDLFNAPIDFYIISMKIIAILSGTLSIYFLFKLLCSILEKYSHSDCGGFVKVILYILSVSIILNPGSIELFYYPECGIMCLSVLLNILAVKALFEYNGKFKAGFIFAILFISTLCYQASLFLYLPMCIMVLSVKLAKERMSKDIVKKYCYNIIINILVVVLVLFSSFILIRFLNTFYTASFHLNNSFAPNSISKLVDYIISISLLAFEGTPVIIYTFLYIILLVFTLTQLSSKVSNRWFSVISIILIMLSTISELARCIIF